MSVRLACMREQCGRTASHGRVQRQGRAKEGTHVCSNDGHGGVVCQGDLVWVIIGDAHSVQVPKVGALSGAVVLSTLRDEPVDGGEELIADAVISSHSLTCIHATAVSFLWPVRSDGVKVLQLHGIIAPSA